jgi:sugar O-acyltransferase (sialic acid O-acetyltransferase NeuD family)
MVKNRLFIVGAGGSGIEIESFLSTIPENKRDFKIEGYLDDNLSALKNTLSDYKILGKVLDYPLQRSDYVILAIANPQTKRVIYQQLKDKVKFYTFIDSTAFIGKYTEIGEGSIICPQCLISTNVKIGRCVYINSASQVGHNTSVGDFSSVMANVAIGGECIIDNEVYFGTGSVVIPRISICNNATIGAGAVVIRKIKESGSYFGNPSRRI